MGKNGEVSIPSRTRITRWFPVRCISKEIDVLSGVDGSLRLSDSLQVTALTESYDESSTEEITNLSEDEFLVETVAESRLNPRTHEREFQTTFVGYSDQSEWIPASNFRAPVPFTTVSKRGRIRYHTAGSGKARLYSFAIPTEFIFDTICIVQK